jgi:hypothetical protein
MPERPKRETPASEWTGQLTVVALNSASMKTAAENRQACKASDRASLGHAMLGLSPLGLFGGQRVKLIGRSVK